MARERELLIAAFGKVASEHGYRGITIEDVAHYAGLSRAHFEIHFATKEKGLIAAQDAFLDALWSEALDACETSAEWPAKVRAVLGSVLEALSEANQRARVFAVEGAASFAAAERQFAVVDR